MTTPDSLLQDLEKAKKALEDLRPEIGWFSRTGAGELENKIFNRKTLLCKKSIGFPPSFENASLCYGKLEGRTILVLEGAPAFYEGVSLTEIAFPVWLFRLLGAETLILTGAGESLNPRIKVGSLLVADDHLNFLGSNPLSGVQQEKLGPLFPDLSNVYDRALASLAIKLGRQEKIPLRSGILAATPGPALETRAEKKFLRQSGADVVLNSVVPEAIAAAHAGLRSLALIAITDEAGARGKKPVSVEAMLAAAEEAAPRLESLLLRLFQEMP